MNNIYPRLFGYWVGCLSGEMIMTFLFLVKMAVMMDSCERLNGVWE